jgi:uncharacterized protein (DUF305 family)
MKNNRLVNITYIFACAVFLGGLTPSFLSYAQDAHEERAIHKEHAERFEIRFMQDMSDHHLSAIEEGNLCVRKATRDELKEMCRQIISDQAHEIEKIQDWLEEWYGISYTPQLRDDDERMIEAMKLLEGHNFNIVFMEMMINHHRQAILMSTDALVVAFHHKLLDLARHMIGLQADEARQFRAWLDDWYGVHAIMPEIGPRG